MNSCPLGGAYGIVYSATDRATNQGVAVKIIPFLQAEITKRLAREIYLLYEIEHPNIVRCAVSSNKKRGFVLRLPLIYIKS
jgi:serine/threonine protein kinase